MHIGLTVDRQTAVLTLADDGRGVTAAELERPTSLGIVGIRERALAVGGQVTITGIGGARNDVDRAGADDQRTGAGTMKRILLVDDHDDVRRAARSILADALTDVTVGEAATAAAALALVAREAWDLVLLDLSLPDRRGLDTLREIRACSPRCPSSS